MYISSINLKSQQPVRILRNSHLLVLEHDQIFVAEVSPGDVVNASLPGVTGSHLVDPPGAHRVRLDPHQAVDGDAENGGLGLEP